MSWKILLMISLVFQCELGRSDDGSKGDDGGGILGKPAAAPPPKLEDLKQLTPGSNVPPEITKCMTAIEAYIATREKCNESSQTAYHWCLAETSPKLHAGIEVVNGLLSAAAMLKKTSDACSKFNDALKMGQAAMTAYVGTCTAVKGLCDYACGNSAEALEKVEKVCNGNLQPDGFSKENSNLETIVKVCKKWGESTASALIGIGSLLQQSGLMGKCNQALAAVNCVQTPNHPQCPQPLDCTKTANAQNVNCICAANPNAPGCPGALASNTGSPFSPGGLPGSALPIANLDKANLNGSLDSSGADLISPTGGSSSGDSKAGVGATGGGGGGMAGGGGSGSGSGGKGADVKKGLNANILSGFDGGGGGGGSGGGRSGSGAGNSQLSAYLPGGQKDPSRNLASQTFGNGEVTAAGSKSNWEKVKERYVENRRSLIGP